LPDKIAPGINIAIKISLKLIVFTLIGKKIFLSYKIFIYLALTNIECFIREKL